jgi:hypothetical protein
MKKRVSTATINDTDKETADECIYRRMPWQKIRIYMMRFSRCGKMSSLYQRKQTQKRVTQNGITINISVYGNLKVGQRAH